MFQENKKMLATSIFTFYPTMFSKVFFIRVVKRWYCQKKKKSVHKLKTCLPTVTKIDFKKKTKKKN